MNIVSKAFELGKLYWQQADSDSYKQNKKSDDTFNQFKALEYEHLEQLEAANQRELELLAVIERVKTFSKEESNGTGTLYSWQIDDLLNSEPSKALREHEAKVLAPESERLDFVLDNLCFIQLTRTDVGTDSYQLMSQNEDEEFFTLHNPDEFFKSPRDAVDAAMAEERRKK